MRRIDRDGDREDDGTQGKPEFTKDQLDYINKTREVVLNLVAGYAAQTEKGDFKSIEELGVAIDKDFAADPRRGTVMFKILLSVAADLLLRDFNNTHNPDKDGK